MFVQIQETPNPNTLKFIPGVEISPIKTFHITKEENQNVSNLANNLLRLDGVSSVFLSYDFISVTKESNYDWQVVKTFVLSAIVDYISSGFQIIQNITENAGSTSGLETEIVRQIKELIDTRVRPAVAEDGGDIVYKDFKDGIVYLEMHGACSGCPSSTITLKNGIESMLKHYVPEIISVEAV